MRERSAVAEKPAKPVETPHTSVPRCLTVSSVAALALATLATRTVAVINALYILSSS